MLLALTGLFAGVLAPHDPVLLDLKNSLAGMSFDYPFGTDELGRCIFSRCLYATRTTFGAALFISAMTIAVGCVIGVVSAYCGGFVDQLVRTVSDALLSIPNPDHYLPLLYIAALRRQGEQVSFPLAGFDGGSISMLCVRFG